MLTNRQKLILKAIVEAYINNGEAVGSKYLTQVPYLDFSSATLRNDMAPLEEFGFLEKTHTSSGRIPSDKAYRYYVEHLITRDAQIIEQFPLIDEVLIKNNQKDETMKEAIKLLSDITKYTAIAVGPTGINAIIKEINFVPLTNVEAIILIVTDNGDCKFQNITITNGILMDDVKKFIIEIAKVLINNTVTQAMRLIVNEGMFETITNYLNLKETILNNILDAFKKFAKNDVYMSGISQMFNNEFEINKQLVNLLDHLDTNDYISSYLSEDEELVTKFGNNMQLKTIDNAIIISIPYQVDDQQYGTIALMGPSRMEYKKVIPLLEYLASNVSKIYKKKE